MPAWGFTVHLHTVGDVKTGTSFGVSSRPASISTTDRQNPAGTSVGGQE